MNSSTGHRRTRMVWDVERETITIALDDGREITMPSDQPYDPELGIRRIAYEQGEHTMTLDLVEGRQVMVEIGGRDTALSLAGRTVVYLDQNQWIKLAQYRHTPDKLRPAERDAAAVVIDQVEAGRVVLPLSGAHLAESGSARTRYRATLVPLMLELSRGWQMRNPLRVRADELRALLTARRLGTPLSAPRTGPAVFTLDPGMLFADYPEAQHIADLPPELAQLHRRQTWAMGLYSAMLDGEAVDRTVADDLAAKWAASFQDLAGALRDNPAARRDSRTIVFARVMVDMQAHLAQAAAGSGMTPDQFHTWVFGQAADDLATLPYLGAVFEATHIRLRNAGDAWHAHDLTDLLYLACASAYADIVVCENKAADYLTRAWRTCTGGAPLITTLTSLVEKLRPTM
ncbi:hypothetical protein [Saccharothrix sp. Mg75]|uniref:hypothetical protein n=1 Tax=Saccharothrix sp. Mg75 TaxID=3445357 RepID=UPI003EECC0F7